MTYLCSSVFTVVLLSGFHRSGDLRELGMWTAAIWRSWDHQFLEHLRLQRLRAVALRFGWACSALRRSPVRARAHARQRQRAT
jgi:hypothetical protein